MLSPYDCHNEEHNEANDASKNTSQNRDGTYCPNSVTAASVEVNSSTAWCAYTTQLNIIRVTVQLDLD